MGTVGMQTSIPPDTWVLGFGLKRTSVDVQHLSRIANLAKLPNWTVHMCSTQPTLSLYVT